MLELCSQEAPFKSTDVASPSSATLPVREGWMRERGFRSSQFDVRGLLLAVKPQQSNPLHDVGGDFLQEFAIDRPALKAAQVERCAENHAHPRWPQPGLQQVAGLRPVLDVGR